MTGSGFYAFAFCFFLSLSFVLTPAFADQAPLQERNSKAIHLIEVCLNNIRVSTSKTLTEVRDLEPGGPEYFNQLLFLLVADPRPWRGTSDHRNSMLFALADALPDEKDRRLWQDWENSPIASQIRYNMHDLLSHAPRRTVRQQLIVRIFNNLNLWDELEMPFMMQALRIKRTDLVDQMSRILKNSGDHLVREAIEEAKKSQHLEALAAFLEQGLLDPSDYFDVLRLRIEWVYTRNIHFLADPPEALVYHLIAAYRIDKYFSQLLGKQDPAAMDVFNIFHTGDAKLRYQISRTDPRLRRAYLRSLWLASTPSFEDETNIISLKTQTCAKLLR